MNLHKNTDSALYLERMDQLSDPVVHLHCLGGHGRSGTLLLARILMTQPEGTVAEELLESLRSQRAQLVESEEQFHFAIQQASDLSGKSFVAGQFKWFKPKRAVDYEPAPLPPTLPSSHHSAKTSSNGCPCILL